MAYDLAAIEYRGANAVTNFDMSNYTKSSVSSSCDLQQISQEANDSCCCFMGSKPLQPDHDDNDDDEEEQQEQQQLIQLQKQDLPAAAMPMPMPISYDHGKYYQEEPAWCSSSSSSFCLDAAAAIFDFDPLQLVDFPEIPALKHQADHDVERPLDNLFDAGGRFENNNIAHDLLFEIEGSDPQEPTLPNVDVDQYLNFVEEII
ncbi:Ethylene-responsive transcription factor wri1 [Dionaea muscipula]